MCKVFRPGASRFFERELRARKDLSDLPEVPPLVDTGEGWIVTPLYTDDPSHVHRHLPGSLDGQLTPAAARALARFGVALHERGLFLLDLSTRNLTSDPVAGLKVIDLEFLQEYAEPAPDVAQSYTFWGLPLGAEGYDEPLLGRQGRRYGRRGPASRQNSAFHPAVTGSSVEALLQPSRRLDGPRRAAVQLGWYVMLQQKARSTKVRSLLDATSWYADLRKVRVLLSRRAAQR